ncbi:hypothetical protein BK004_04260 [bacterium CG10_46_32]|nr:MAG: hypothetical protein BK004_04260 [bacterium CG10_46_32]PIR55831.1 MAG: hypothetical protein COU73_04300 [Parcubacteria group bacterium CG10_big_fil_rev_8_21_14_0_10_46_32]
MLKSKKQRNAVNAILMMVFVFAVVLVLNLFSTQFFMRFDVTENNNYSISSATKTMLKNVDDTVTITAYFTRELPGYLLVRNQEVKDMLTEFEAVSNGKVSVSFLDPSTDTDVEKDAQEIGIPTLQFNVVEKDAFQVTNGYLGIVVQYGDAKEIIPFVQDSASLEYDIAVIVNRITREKVPMVGIANLSGASILVAHDVLERQYALQDILLSDGNLIPDDVDALIVFSSTDSLSSRSQYVLDQFLMRGGSMLMLAEGTRINWDTLTAETLDSSIFDLLGQWGVRLHKNLVLDASNEFAGFRTDQTQFFVPYPFWVKTQRDGFNPDSGIVNKLESAVFPWVSSVAVLDTTLTDATEYIDLVRTTNHAWELDKDWQLNPQMIQPPLEDTFKSYVLALMLSGHFESFFSKETIPGRTVDDGGSQASNTVPKEDQENFLASTEQGRLIVVGDIDFAVDANINRFSANKILFSNMVDALASDDALIAIRSKSITDRPLQTLTDSQKSWIRWGTIFGVPILFSLYGLVRFIRRRNQTNPF